MARTPASVDADLASSGSNVIYLRCDICNTTILEGFDWVSFTDMVDAHEEHADKIHGEGV